jgi:hypothetical protein
MEGKMVRKRGSRRSIRSPGATTFGTANNMIGFALELTDETPACVRLVYDSECEPLSTPHAPDNVISVCSPPSS